MQRRDRRNRAMLAAGLAGLAGCSNSAAGVDAGFDHDGSILDAAGDPPPPALGAQYDRAGRPAIRGALVGTYAAAGVQAARRDAYDRASDPAAWRTTPLQTDLTIERELEINLAVFDAFDLGVATIPFAGCQNALLYDGTGGGPNAMSYLQVADLFADDQLYLDTSKATCNLYLELELFEASGHAIPHLSCGGRTLSYDVVDMTYAVLAAGTAGLDQANGFSPRLGDGVGPHGDVKDTFPFLGAPH